MPDFLGGVKAHTFPTAADPGSVLFDFGAMIAQQEKDLLAYVALHGNGS